MSDDDVISVAYSFPAQYGAALRDLNRGLGASAAESGGPAASQASLAVMAVAADGGPAAHAAAGRSLLEQLQELANLQSEHTARGSVYEGLVGAVLNKLPPGTAVATPVVTAALEIGGGDAAAAAPILSRRFQFEDLRSRYGKVQDTGAPGSGCFQGLARSVNCTVLPLLPPPLPPLSSAPCPALPSHHTLQHPLVLCLPGFSALPVSGSTKLSALTSCSDSAEDAPHQTILGNPM